MWGNEESINGGLDLAMPGAGFGFWGDNLIPYVENGTVPESRIDDAVRSIHGTYWPIANLPAHLQAIRVLAPWIASGQADHPRPP